MAGIEEDVLLEISEGRFQWQDYVIFCFMLVISLGVGLYQAYIYPQNSTKEFLLGDRSMSNIPVALSLIGGAISAVSILG